MADPKAPHHVRVTSMHARDEMLLQLRRLGIRDARVLDAMAHVPREEFVRASDREVAYGDHALPIGEGQTISQPYIVARMTELLDPRSTDRVLEVGTGSGYQAAVLGQLAADVVTVERHASLAQAAGDLLARLGYRNVRVVQDDASLGYPARAPYDRILVTAAAPQIDPALAAQLTPAGRIVAPVGDEEMQELVVHHANGRAERHGAVRFVPLRGAAGFRS
jgi:protein-L-isoaspartate(D-aspartate) O-methyltransferase